MTKKTVKQTWTKPLAEKLGTMKDVAGGSFAGNEQGGPGSSKNPVS